MNAARRATAHERFAIARERSGGGEHDAGLCNHRVDCAGIVRVGNEHVGRAAQMRAQLRELIGVATGDRPPQLAADAIVEVLGRLRPGKTGSAVEHDVVRRGIVHEAAPRANAA